jgi:toxin-antitoxin system PIN domain toxin
VTYLLDVNVLIALIDPGHVAHEDAHHWFETTGRFSWATCPITENGVLRIVGNSQYPNSPGSPAALSGIITTLRALPGHEFWSDDISLVDTTGVDPARIMTSGQVTDTYLLALASCHKGELATFDRKLAPFAIKGGKAALHLIQGRQSA